MSISFLMIALSTLFTAGLYAQNAQNTQMTAKVLQVSKSQRSFIADRGELSGLKRGDVFLVYTPASQADGLKGSERIIARGEVVGTKMGSSIWLVRERGLAINKLIKNKSFAFQSIKELGIGRQGLELSKNKVFFTGSEKDNLEGLIKGGEVPLSLELERESNFQIHKIMKQDEPLAENVKLSYLKELDEGQVKKINPLSKAQAKQLNDRASVMKKAENEIIVTSTFLAGMEGSDPDGLTDIENQHSLYADRVREKRNRRLLAIETKKQIKQSGPLWSGALSDEELRAFYIRTGIEEERSRGERDIEEPFAQQFAFSYGGSFTEHALEGDDQYHGKGTTFGIFYQRPLANKGSWSYFDFKIDYQKSHQFFGLDVGNVKASQTHFGIGVNWYFKRPSFAIGKILPFVGLGISRGSGEMESNRFNQIYNYDLWVIPQLSLGLSYRFKSGDSYREWLPISFGLFTLLQYQQFQLNLGDSNSNQLPTSYSTSDISLHTGLALFF